MKSAGNPTTTRTSISHADAVRKCEHLYAPTQTLLAENLSKSSSAKQTGTFCRLCATFLFFNILLGMGMYFVLRPIAYVLGGIQQLCGPNFVQFTTYPTSNLPPTQPQVDKCGILWIFICTHFSRDQEWPF